MKKTDNVKIQETLAQLLSQYRKFRQAVWAVLAILVAALVSAFINRYVTFALLGAALLFHLLYVRKQQKAYTNSVSRANISLTVMPKLGAEDVSERSTGGITASVVKRAGMMPCDEDPTVFWGMEGDTGEFHVQIADITIPERFELKKAGKKRVHFNIGVWTHVVLPENTGFRYCVIDETAVPTPIRMAYFDRDPVMFSAELGEQDLKGKVVLYRPLGEEDQRPSPAILKAMKELISYTPGYMAMSLHGNELDVFVRGRFLTGPVTASQKPTEASLAFDPFPEYEYILRIASACAKKRRLPELEDADA